MSAKVPKHEKDDIPVEAEELATHQEAIPLPYVAGTRHIAGRWMAPATAMITKKAEGTPGKK
jgi:hypothetical protein